MLEALPDPQTSSYSHGVETAGKGSGEPALSSQRFGAGLIKGKESRQQGKLKEKRLGKAGGEKG